MTGVVGLGYVVVSATDLDAWEDFACGVLGLQCAVKNADQLQLRLDDKSYRLDIRRSDEDKVQTLGWEVRGERDLRHVADRLREAGYSVGDKTDDDARERRVSGLVGLEDPDGASLELFYGLSKDRSPFVSPVGARFCTGLEGLGHAFQLVSDTDAFWHLYVDLLGFRLSDYIDFAPGFTGTFLHCNPRHHSFAFAHSPDQGIQHLMFEVDNIDAVGRAYDKVLGGSAPITATFGKHSNDEMLSFYSKTPSGFSVEYGTAGISIDDETWTPARYDVPSFWGHKR